MVLYSSGYWQVGLAEKVREKTALCTDQGLFQWTVMSFGLNNAPAMFQHLRQTIISDLRYDFLLVYFDDLIVFGSSVQVTLRQIGPVL